MYNHNKAQQSKNRVHISWNILYAALAVDELLTILSTCKMNYICENLKKTNPSE